MTESPNEYIMDSPHGWLKIQQESGFFYEDSGLIVVNCEESSMACIAAASFIAMRFALKNEEGKNRFDKIALMVPPGGEDNIYEDFLSHLKTKMEEGGAPELIVKIAPSLMQKNFLDSLEGMKLCDIISQLPSRASCIILKANLIRFADKTTLNKKNIAKNLKEVNNPHVNHLLNQLSSIIKTKDMIVIILCDHTSVEIENIIAPADTSFFSIDSKREPSQIEMIPNLTQLVDVFREGGWCAVKEHASYDSTKEEILARRFFEQFGQEGDLVRAWTAIKPFAGVADKLIPTNILSMAGAAFVSDELEESLQLLMLATKEKLCSVEDLSVASRLAYDLEEAELFEKLVNRITNLFPENPHALRAEYLRLFKHRKFTEALILAQQLKMVFEEAQCRCFLTEPLNPQEFLSQMEKIGELEQGHIVCAEEALFRGDWQQAYDLAAKIPVESNYHKHSFIIRIDAIHEGFNDENHGSDCTEKLISLMQYVAKHPDDSLLRNRIERLLEHQLVEPLVIVSLSAIAARLTQEKTLTDDNSISTAKELVKKQENQLGAQDVKDLSTFLEEFLKHFKNIKNRFVIGQGNIPNHLIYFVGNNMKNDLIKTFANEEFKNFESSAFWLHLIVLVCKEAKDPSGDFKALQSTTEYLSSMNSPQAARDMSETALQFWPGTQPDYRSWRISLGWLTLSDSCLRSKNTLAALRYLCFALIAHKGSSLDVDILRRTYRLTARIFRDLKFTELALTFIKYEENLYKKLGHTDENIPIEIFKIQTALPKTMSASESEQLEVLWRTHQLAELDIGSETYPLVALQANLFRVIPTTKIPAEIKSSFYDRLENSPEPLKSFLKASTSPTPTTGEIAAILAALPHAQDHQYLAYQINSALPAAANALNHALKTKDSDLFFVASQILAQPSLGVKMIENDLAAVSQSQVPSLLKTVTKESLEKGDLTPIPQYSFQPLSKISLKDLQHCLDDTEAVVIITSEPSHHPYFMVVTKNNISEPRQINTWSISDYSNWKANHKEDFQYNIPNPYLPSISPIDPPIKKILEIVKNLSLELTNNYPQISILPASHLFGFTWGLSPHLSGFLSEKTSLCITPSAAWLVTARGNRWNGKRIRKSWIGSAKIQDKILLGLKSSIQATLSKNHFLHCEEYAPHDFMESELIFIGAHGNAGTFEYFKAVSDTLNQFSATEFAHYLSGCGCVILAVCSGGRSDSQHGNEETLGLVTALFKVGVRCVVAPPWPINPEVFRFWLPAFLESMENGETAGEAATKARDAVRLQFNHPCIWGQMHLYGDQLFRLSTESPLISAE